MTSLWRSHPFSRLLFSIPPPSIHRHCFSQSDAADESLPARIRPATIPTPPNEPAYKLPLFQPLLGQPRVLVRQTIAEIRNYEIIRVFPGLMSPYDLNFLVVLCVLFICKIVNQGGDGFFNEILNGLLLSRHKCSYPPSPTELNHPIENNGSGLVLETNVDIRDPSDSGEDESPLLKQSTNLRTGEDSCQTAAEDLKFSFPNEKFRFGLIPAGSTDAVVICTIGARDAMTSALQIVLGKSVCLDIAQVSCKILFLGNAGRCFKEGSVLKWQVVLKNHLGLVFRQIRGNLDLSHSVDLRMKFYVGGGGLLSHRTGILKRLRNASSQDGADSQASNDGSKNTDYEGDFEHVNEIGHSSCFVENHDRAATLLENGKYQASENEGTCNEDLVYLEISLEIAHRMESTTAS
ncbi:hypothetical protein CQW23_33969 [Capsicum baccatum]|uniref:Uncharacterized protein n=1 Tax=Capsicum baccatum TaxID=33114 RepID=A0A2G2V0D2_CAPBA|nr:hypothetical protein CQW23_33969 [Capsicum baccatum]